VSRRVSCSRLIESRHYLSVDSLPGVGAGLPAEAGVPARAARVPAGRTRAARVPAAGPVPVARVAGVAVVKAGTPVIVGQRPGRPGECLSDARRAQTRKS
jgi:hypothetical protein